MRCLAFEQGARAATERTCSSVSSSWIWHWLSATACSSADSDVMARGGTESVRVSGSEEVDWPAPEEEPAAEPAVAVAARPYEAPVTARRCGPTAPCSAWRGRGRARGIVRVRLLFPVHFTSFVKTRQEKTTFELQKESAPEASAGRGGRECVRNA
jgi:hypothetical protein